MDQVESDANQRSKINWLTLVDRNSKFFSEKMKQN